MPKVCVVCGKIEDELCDPYPLLINSVCSECLTQALKQTSHYAVIVVINKGIPEECLY